MTRTRFYRQIAHCVLLLAGVFLVVLLVSHALLATHTPSPRGMAHLLVRQDKLTLETEQAGRICGFAKAIGDCGHPHIAYRLLRDDSDDSLVVGTASTSGPLLASGEDWAFCAPASSVAKPSRFQIFKTSCD